LANGAFLAERGYRSAWGVSGAVGVIVMGREEVVVITQPTVLEVIAAVQVEGRRKLLWNWLTQRGLRNGMARLAA
jgi:hypothetical protein